MIRLDRDAKRAFDGFLAGKTLTANQIQFVNLVIDYLTQSGCRLCLIGQTLAKYFVGPIACVSGGEAGIRTLGTGVSPYNGLANRRIRPLCHLSGVPAFSLPRSEIGIPAESCAR